MVPNTKIGPNATNNTIHGKLTLFRELRYSYLERMKTLPHPEKKLLLSINVAGLLQNSRKLSSLRSKNSPKRKKLTPMKTFLALTTPRDIATDFMDEFVKTSRGFNCLLVIVDQFSKLVRNVLLTSRKAYDVARVFTIIDVKELFKTTHRPQTNGQTELTKQTNFSALKKFVSEHQR